MATCCSAHRTPLEDYMVSLKRADPGDQSWCAIFPIVYLAAGISHIYATTKVRGPASRITYRDGKLPASAAVTRGSYRSRSGTLVNPSLYRYPGTKWKPLKMAENSQCIQKEANGSAAPNCSIWYDIIISVPQVSDISRFSNVSFVEIYHEDQRFYSHCKHSSIHFTVWVLCCLMPGFETSRFIIATLGGEGLLVSKWRFMARELSGRNDGNGMILLIESPPHMFLGFPAWKAMLDSHGDGEFTVDGDRKAVGEIRWKPWLSENCGRSGTVPGICTATVFFVEPAICAILEFRNWTARRATSWRRLSWNILKPKTHQSCPVSFIKMDLCPVSDRDHCWQLPRRCRFDEDSLCWPKKRESGRLHLERQAAMNQWRLCCTQDSLNPKPKRWIRKGIVLGKRLFFNANGTRLRNVKPTQSKCSRLSSLESFRNCCWHCCNRSGQGTIDLNCIWWEPIPTSYSVDVRRWITRNDFHPQPSALLWCTIYAFFPTHLIFSMKHRLLGPINPICMENIILVRKTTHVKLAAQLATFLLQKNLLLDAISMLGFYKLVKTPDIEAGAGRRWSGVGKIFELVFSGNCFEDAQKNWEIVCSQKDLRFVDILAFWPGSFFFSRIFKKWLTWLMWLRFWFWNVYIDLPKFALYYEEILFSSP